MLQFIRSQRVGHDSLTEQQQLCCKGTECLLDDLRAVVHGLLS